MSRTGVVLALMLVTAAATGRAGAETDKVADRYAQEAERVRVEAEKAEAEFRTLNQATIEFQRLADRPAEERDRALEPARLIYPDYRLRYRSSRDECRVLEVLNEATRLALLRGSTLYGQAVQQSHMVSVYHNLMAQVKASQIRGAPFLEADVQKVMSDAISKLEAVSGGEVASFALREPLDSACK